MKYMLTKDDVIYIIPGNKEFKINCIKGKLWLTKKADIKDYILTIGDNMLLKKCGKVAVMAFADSCITLEGSRFDLVELKSYCNEFRINKIRIKQADHTF